MTTQSTQQKTEPNGFLPWIMWILAALFYSYEFFLQFSPSVMVNELMKAFHVTAGQLGNLSAFYLYAYAIMQIPIGILLDRYGARRLLTLASLLCAVGALIFGSTHSFTVAACGRALIGLGSAFAAISCMHIAALWLPIKRFALLVGVMLTIGMLGAIFAQAPLSIMMTYLGWRNTMFMFGAIGVVLSVAIYAVIRDKPMNIAQNAPATVQKETFFSGARFVLKNKQTWLASLYGGLMYLSTPAFAGLWGVSFLMNAYYFSRTQAAFLISFAFVGWAVGSPFFGWFSDRIKKRRPPMLIGTLGTLATLLMIIYLHLPYFILGAVLFGFGFFSSGFLPAFSIAREVNPPATNATALGFVNTLNTLGAGLAQPLIGIVLDWQLGTGRAGTVHVFSVAHYHVALALLPLCVFIALLILPLIRETHCKASYQ